MSEPYFIVVIDDERTLPLTEVPVLTFRTSDDGIAGLKEFEASGAHLDELWLDHDLGEDSSKPYGWDTIMPVVQYLEERAVEGHPLDIGLILVHTQNIAAVPAMLDALRPHYRVVRASFPV